MPEKNKKNKKRVLNNKKNSEKKTKKKLKEKIKNKITRKNLFYFIIAVIDISFIIYCARHNYANYVMDRIEGDYYYVGDSKDLLFGKNYITLIFSSFIYIYILLSNRVFFQKKNSKKNMIKLFIIIFLINIIIFCIFTKRIY